MAVFRRSKSSGVGAAAGPAAATGLAAVLHGGIRLPAQREESLRKALEEGTALHDSINEQRLELAIATFEPEMRHSLYETLFLLHVNDPRLAEWRFTPVRGQDDRQNKRPDPEQTVNLFVEGAPHGVQGIDQLSPRFRDDFHSYVHATFQMEIGAHRGAESGPFVSLHSIGSTGTIGHKPGASDLDLQVVYSLEPFSYSTDGLNDDALRETVRREYAALMREIGSAKKLTREKIQDPLVQKMLQGTAATELGKQYPNLSKYLLRREGDYASDFKQPGGEALRIQCLHETINLLKRAQKLQYAQKLAQDEKLLLERIRRIQDYLARKFPTAEVYLFPMSIDNYRLGRYSSTLEFKESSGSAYELILNHDTLMPGLQFTPVLPSHFVFPQEVNNNAALFTRLSDYIRFGSVRVYDAARPRLVNLGSAPDLTREYIARHSGAAYWEAFKASSGNLPKSTLNLLRYEMLLDPRFLKTVIQLVKEPGLFDGHVSRGGAAPGLRSNAIAAMPTSGLLELEALFPLLRRDPWWLRYKALKIAFAEAEGIKGIEWTERERLSGVIDLAFGLHCRVSDVFTKPGDRRAFESYRERALVDYLSRAFPQGSPQRNQVEQIFIGEVNAVNSFEESLRTLFKRSLARVLDTVASLKLKDEPGRSEEFTVWYHYYQENFDPLPNMVRRSIMQNLKVPRGRVQIGFESNVGWIFRSLQRQSGVGKRFDTFGMLDHLPDNVTLLEHPSFLHGLAHCILNGYYGVMNRGTLKEFLTALEFDGARLDVGNQVHNTMAFLRPDQVSRIMHAINEHLQYQEYNYLDVIRAERRFTEVMVFLNLWQFGRISILSRDNLRGWYVHEYDHPELLKDAKAFHRSPEKMLGYEGFQRTLGSHFDTHKVLLNEAKLAVWVNPNSLETSHAAGQDVLKEGDLSRQFERLIRDRHAG